MTKFRKYRDKDFIYYDCLQCLLKHKMKKTELMYCIQLTYRDVKIYTDFLIQHNLIREYEEKHYTITDKGIKYIKAFDIISELLKAN